MSWQLPTHLDRRPGAGRRPSPGSARCRIPILPIYREREVGFVVRQLGSPCCWWCRGSSGASTTRPWRRVLAAGQEGLEVWIGLELGAALEAEPSVAAPRRPLGRSQRRRCAGCSTASGTTADPKGAQAHRSRACWRRRGARCHPAASSLRDDDRIALVFPRHPRRRDPLADRTGCMVGCAHDRGSEIFDPDDDDVPCSRRHGVTQAGGGHGLPPGLSGRPAGARRARRSFRTMRSFPGWRCARSRPQLHYEVQQGAGSVPASSPATA